MPFNDDVINVLNTEFEANKFTLKMKRNPKSLLVHENNINEKKNKKSEKILI